MLEFEAFPKIPRYKRAVTVTEKIDGTNGQIALVPITSEEVYGKALADPYCLRILQALSSGETPMALYAGSRNRWLTPGKTSDNYGFAAWVLDNCDLLRSLGEGRHYGEWYGQGIGRNYGLNERRFALFNTARWNKNNPNKPYCCGVVPVLGQGFNVDVDEIMLMLAFHGSFVSDLFQEAEGVVVFHSASQTYYKQTFGFDGGKWQELKEAA